MKTAACNIFLAATLCCVLTISRGDQANKGNTQQDICQICKCSNSIITCKFGQSSFHDVLLDSNWKIPRIAGKMLIYAEGKSIRLRRGFLQGSKINSFTLTGTRREQLEVESEAFEGNEGPFPEIRFHNLNSVIIRQRGISKNAMLIVEDVNDCVLFANAFENAKINCTFKNINDLRIQENTFILSTANLQIVSSQIGNISSLGGSLHVILFRNSKIGRILRDAFNMFKANSTIFEGCQIGTIESGAFTEKLNSPEVSIINSTIENMERGAISGSGIGALVLQDNNIDAIQESAIETTAVNVTIMRNQVKHCGKNCVNVKDYSNVIVRSNKFGVFDGIHIEPSNQKGECRFENNSITEPKSGSLNLHANCMLAEISLNTPCLCLTDWLQRFSSRDLRSQIYCTIDDKLRYCFNASSINAAKYVNEVCDETKTTLHCGANVNLKKINDQFFTPEELEQNDNLLTQRLIAVVSLVFLLIIVLCGIAFAVVICYKRRKSRKESDLFSYEQSHMPTAPSDTYDDPSIVSTTGGGNSVGGTVGNRNAQLSTETQLGNEHCGGADGTQLEEPTYAELIYAQQPLLRDEYASPTDRNIDDQNVYADPINERDISAVPSAYAISNMRPPYATPHCSKLNQQAVPLPQPHARTQPSNLPDVLHRSDKSPGVSGVNHNVPQANVKRIAQDLQNMPKFHLNQFAAPAAQLPPIYTAPNAKSKQHPSDRQAGKPVPRPRLALAELDYGDPDMRGAVALPPDTGSNYSGGSDETAKMDDVIQYADA